MSLESFCDSGYHVDHDAWNGAGLGVEEGEGNAGRGSSRPLRVVAAANGVEAIPRTRAEARNQGRLIMVNLGWTDFGDLLCRTVFSYI